jgi:hypothetical protein
MVGWRFAMGIVKRKRRCVICGKVMRRHNTRDRCRNHGDGLTFDNLTGECLICGEIVEARKRGAHALRHKGPPWNKGLTKETDERMASISEKLMGHAVSEETKQKARTAFSRPDVQKRMRKAQSIAQTRRFSRVEEREKSRERTVRLVEEGKIIPYGGRKHGNGKKPTVDEREMCRRLLRNGFVPEYVVSTGTCGGGVPSHYKLDLAEPIAMVAVELDGSSHHPKARRESDERKDAFLKRAGWTVLRFENPFDYDLAAAKCLRVVGTKGGYTT